MNTYPTSTSFPFLLFVLFITSCNGQAKTDTSEPGALLPIAQPKIVKNYPNLNGNIHSMLEDKSGNLWFATTYEGVYRYDGTYFTHFTEQNGLSSNGVNDIIEDKTGQIVFATDRGICRYDGRSFRPFPENSGFNSFIQAPDLSKAFIWSLLEDKDGNLWIGTANSGVYRYDGQAFSNFLNKGNFNLGTQHQAIIDIMQDKRGNLWFCSWNRGGVWRYDGRSFTNFLPPPAYYQPADTVSNYVRSVTSPADYISDDMIFSAFEDQAGDLWFATRRHGACRYDGQSFTSFREEQEFVSRGVYCMLEDRQGNFWFSTEDNGVYRYDGEAFMHFTTQDGLVNNSVFSMLEDTAGNLWFGTRETGLSRYDGKVFTRFSE